MGTWIHRRIKRIINGEYRMGMNKKNIYLITIDCMRHDALIQENMPFLYLLQQESTTYNKAYATGPFTSASFPSILGGIMPLKYGYYAPLPPQINMIQQTLQQKGYLTIGINSNPYLSKFFGYNKGFIVFEDFLSYEKRTENKNKIITMMKEWILGKVGVTSHTYNFLTQLYLKLHLPLPNTDASKSAYEQNDKLKEILELNKQELPLFVWQHYMDGHSPYTAIGKYRKQQGFKGDSHRLNFIIHKNPEKIRLGEISELKKLYLASLSQIDENIKDLFLYLKTRGLLKDSLIIITADHGEEFGEHGGMTHFAKMTEELLHIPLIIFDNEKQEKAIDDELLSLIEIPNFILSWLNLEKRERNKEFVQGECSYKNKLNFFEERTNIKGDFKELKFIKKRLENIQKL